MAITHLRIRPAVPVDHPVMLALWERSVRATHTFLTEKDVADLRPHVSQGFESTAVRTPDGKTRFPPPSEIGYVVRCSSSTRSCWSSACSS
jgi:hypothetical protein